MNKTIPEPARPQPPRILLPVILVSAATVASLILAVVRDVLIADWFGASIISDVFFFALVIPNLFENIIGISLKDALIPFLTEAKHKGRASLLRLIGDLQGVTLAISGAVALGCLLLAGPLVTLFAPGFSPEAQALAVLCLRLVTGVIVLNTLIYLGNAVLNIHGEFLLPALRPVIMNVGIIAGGLLLQGWIGGAQALTLGFVAGLALQWGIQGVAFRRQRIPYRFSFAVGSLRGLLPALWVFIPVFVSALAFQINVLADRMFASGFGEGSIAVLSFAFRLATLPVGIVSLSIITVVFPRQAGFKSQGDLGSIVGLTDRALASTLLIMLPASVGIILISQPLVSLVLQHGAFGAEAARATVSLVVLYCLGLLPYAGIYTLSRSFYALGDAWTPARISLVTMALNIALDLVLMQVMGLPGLALATTLSFAFNLAALLVIYWQRYRASRPRHLAGFALRVTVASTLMGLVLFLTNLFLGSSGLAAGSAGTRLLATGLEVLAGISVFALAALVLRIEEVDLVVSRLRRLAMFNKGAGGAPVLSTTDGLSQTVAIDEPALEGIAPDPHKN